MAWNIDMRYAVYAEHSKQSDSAIDSPLVQLSTTKGYFFYPIAPWYNPLCEKAIAEAE